MATLQICKRKLLYKLPLAVFGLAVMALTLPQGAEAQNFITISNNYLVNDYTWLNNPDSLPAQVNGKTPAEVWRYQTGDRNRPQFATVSDSAAAGLGDVFDAPVDLTTNGVADLEIFDPGTATLDNIYPNFQTGDLDFYFYSTAQGGGAEEVWSQSVTTNANQQYDGWYTITLDTVGGTYTATSGVVNVFDPSFSTQGEVSDNIISNWNAVLTWAPSDPFASGGIPYSDINDVSVQFFYTNVVPIGTYIQAPNGNTLPLIFSVYSPSIYYTTTFAGEDTAAPAAPNVATDLFSTTAIQLIWTNVPDTDVDFYTIKRSLSSGSNYTAIATNFAAIAQTNFSYVDGSLDLDTTYYYVVTATDLIGNESTNSTEVSATTLATAIGGTIVSFNLVPPLQLDNDLFNIDADESFGVPGLGTVVSNWNNGFGSGDNLLFESGLHSTVAFSGAGGVNGFNSRFNDTPMRGGSTAFEVDGLKTMTIANLNENFPHGCYVIAYLSGYDANDGASITDGTKTNYWRVDTTYMGTLTEATSTSTNLFQQATYAVFGSTNAPLTADSVQLSFKTMVSLKGCAIGGVQIVAVPFAGPTVIPNITEFSVSNGTAVLTWDSEEYVNYGVLKKSALTGGSWTEVTNVPGAVGSTMATVPAVSAEEFFQIEGN